jgi:hypothetical protein
MDGGGKHISIKLTQYNITKTTKCGAWIEMHARKPRFVDMREGVHKRFAHKTAKDALTSYMARKKCQIRILENRLSTAINCKEVADREYNMACR